MTLESFSEDPLFPEIAIEIQSMAKNDQAMRKRWEAGDYSGKNFDQEHTDRMKEIVERIGWPTISKVGRDASHSAWLLVQHADHDIDFQKRCLGLAKSCLQTEVRSDDVAYLEDRVRVNQGLEQLYGTQFHEVAGKHVPLPIEDEARVDVRRAEMGLGTLEGSIAKMNSLPR